MVEVETTAQSEPLRDKAEQFGLLFCGEDSALPSSTDIDSIVSYHPAKSLPVHIVSLSTGIDTGI